MSYQGGFSINVHHEEPELQQGYLDYIQQQNIAKRHAFDAERRKKAERTPAQKVRDKFRRIFGGQQPVPIPADPNVRLPPAYGHYIDPNDPIAAYERLGPVGWEQHFPEWDNIGQDYEEQCLNAQQKKYFQKRGIVFIKKLGKGGFGEVWEVKKPMEGQRGKERLACKVMSIKRFEKDHSVRDGVHNLLWESELMKELNHKNIVRQTDVIEIPDAITGFPFCFIFQFMELCHGSLKLLHMPKPGKMMTENEAKAWFRDAANGLKYLHDNHMSHLDIKPDNILYIRLQNSYYSPMVFKLTDFGLAVKFEALTPNVHNIAQGTKVFMAPEIFTSPQYETKPADIYSLGLTLVSSLFKINAQPVPHLQRLLSWGSNTSLYTVHNRCRELIVNMCKDNPQERWTIDQVLSSQWLNT